MFMFIKNKYYKVYNQIISRAQSERRVRGERYYESHHILPKCVGGLDIKSNLVLLTAKEHFICHHLLTKITHSELLKYAFWSMCNQSNKHQNRTYKITSRVYENAKLNFSKLQSSKLMGVKPKYTMTPEHKQKLRNRMKLNNPMFDPQVASKASIRAKRQMLINNPMCNRESRIKCSKSKMGLNNPNSIGLYHTPWGVYESAKSAADSCQIKINPSTISSYCKNSFNIPNTRTMKRSPLLSIEMEGKTFGELGFYLS